MANHTLITYASKHGATAEIAEKIGATIKDAGLTIDVQSIERVQDLSVYDNIIIGSAVYIGQWQKKAAKFLKNNDEILRTKKVWLFSTGPTGKGDPVELMQGWRFPEGLQGLADKIKPKDITVFHGALDESKLNTLEKMTIKMVKAPIGDFRDWKAVEDWTLEIINKLQSADPN